MMEHILQTIEWPNVIAGAIIATFLGFFSYTSRLLFQYYLARRSILRYGQGIWYSAEYDPKGDVPKEHRTTFLEVEISATLSGRVKIRSIKQLNSEVKPIETGWILNGKIRDGALIGEWHTTIKGTLRFGSAMLRFLDNGRAVGYWIGSRGYDPPLYGYWILSKNFEDLKSIISRAVPPGTFTMVDVAKKVADFEKGTRGARI